MNNHKIKIASDWTDECVKNLWDWVSTRQRMADTYFAYQVGEGVVNFLVETGLLKGDVLDYGCGAGFLVDHLLKKNVNVSGADFSEKTISLVNEKFGGNSGWGGAKIVNGFHIPYQSNSFNVVVCTETLEHVSEDRASALLKEFNRILKADGVLLITTPFMEEFDKDTAYCPFCNSEFHKWQHIRAFSTDDVRTMLNENKYEVIFCEGLDFREFKNDNYLSLSVKNNYDIMSIIVGFIRLLRRYAKHKAFSLLDSLFPRQFPDRRVFRYKILRAEPKNICAVSVKRNDTL